MGGDSEYGAAEAAGDSEIGKYGCVNFSARIEEYAHKYRRYGRYLAKERQEVEKGLPESEFVKFVF